MQALCLHPVQVILSYLWLAVFCMILSVTYAGIVCMCYGVFHMSKNVPFKIKPPVAV